LNQFTQKIQARIEFSEHFSILCTFLIQNLKSSIQHS
jgi:hypothetical protein